MCSIDIGWRDRRKEIFEVLKFMKDDRERLYYGLTKSEKHFVSLKIPYKNTMS